MAKNLESYDIILGALEVLSPEEQVEVLSNVLIYLGMSKIDTSEPEITPENLVRIVLDDKKKNGETIYNAFVLQGIAMNQWYK